MVRRDYYAVVRYGTVLVVLQQFGMVGMMMELYSNHGSHTGKLTSRSPLWFRRKIWLMYCRYHTVGTIQQQVKTFLLLHPHFSRATHTYIQHRNVRKALHSLFFLQKGCFICSISFDVSPVLLLRVPLPLGLLLRKVIRGRTRLLSHEDDEQGSHFQ